MTNIETVQASEILDSRGNPTVHATVVLEGGRKRGRIGAFRGKHRLS